MHRLLTRSGPFAAGRQRYQSDASLATLVDMTRIRSSNQISVALTMSIKITALFFFGIVAGAVFGGFLVYTETNMKNEKTRAILKLSTLPLTPITAAYAERLRNSVKNDEHESPIETFRDCADVCPDMIAIPAGSFLMGGGAEKELPLHLVNVPRFAVGKFDITNAEWDACAADHGCRSRDPNDDHSSSRGSYPVVMVNWNDTQDYANWLSRKTGKQYRLPTEAEWEYAARANASFYPVWKFKSTQANLTTGNMTPVGAYPPNAFGLYDTIGNVWQWVEDCWNFDYQDTPTDGRAATTGQAGWKRDTIKNCDRVTRGSDYRGSIENQSSAPASRGGDKPTSSTNFLGFRIARELQ